MRSTFLAGLALTGLLAAAVPIHAQTKDSKVGGKTADEWLKELQSREIRDPSVKQKAIGALTQFGSGIQKKAGPAFIFILQEKEVDGSVRVNAAIAIGTIGLDAKDMDKGVAALVLLLSNTQAIVRLHATMALGRLGPPAKAAIPKLARDTINDKSSWEIRKAAASALASIALDREKGPDTVTVAALTRAIHSPYADVCALVRLEAIVSLSILGVSGRAGELETVLDTLKGAMNDRDKCVAIWARVLTVGYNKDAALDPHLKVIGKYLADNDLEVRNHAARSLSALGPRARPLIPLLIKNLRDPEMDAASAAAQTLIAFKDMLTDKDLDAIADLFKSPEVEHRRRAAHMIGLLGSKGDRCIEQLIGLLKDNDMQVAILAAFALGEIGPPARKALPGLNAVTNHKEVAVQNVAREAISKIELPLPWVESVPGRPNRCRSW
jgi:HEAT repeat protein